MTNLMIKTAFTSKSLKEFISNGYADNDYAQYVELGSRCYVVQGRAKCKMMNRAFTENYEGNEDIKINLDNELAEKLRLVLCSVASRGGNISTENAYTFKFLNYFSDLPEGTEIA